MPLQRNANTGDALFETLMELRMGIDSFASNWSNCDRIATYVARVVGQSRTDSLRYANLFSSALNELMETVFRAHRSDGEIALCVSRAGGIDRIELTIPCDDAVRRFYEYAIDRLGDENIAESYMQALFAGGELDPHIGLLELAIDYKARLSLLAGDGDAVRLTADVALEDINSEHAC